MTEYLDDLERAFLKALETQQREKAKELLGQIETKVPQSSTRLALLKCRLHPDTPMPAETLEVQRYKISLLPEEQRIPALLVHLDTYAADVPALTHLAHLYTKTCRYHAAIHCMESIMLIQAAADPLVLTRIAELYYSLKEYETAGRYYSQVALQSSGDATDNLRAWWGVYLSARQCRQSGQWEEVFALARERLAKVYPTAPEFASSV